MIKNPKYSEEIEELYAESAFGRIQADIKAEFDLVIQLIGWMERRGFTSYNNTVSQSFIVRYVYTSRMALDYDPIKIAKRIGIVQCRDHHLWIGPPEKSKYAISYEKIKKWICS